MWPRRRYQAGRLGGLVFILAVLRDSRVTMRNSRLPTQVQLRCRAARRRLRPDPVFSYAGISTIIGARSRSRPCSIGVSQKR